MLRGFAIGWLGVLLVAPLGAETGSFAAERAKARLYPYANDLGPEQIDVSSYPLELQRTYRQLILGKCSRCHGAARTLNSEFAQPEVWKLYIRRMAAKPGSGIDSPEAQKIWEFLVYDSRQRKLGAQAKTWEAHRQKLLAEFKRKEPFRYKELYETK